MGAPGRLTRVMRIVFDTNIVLSALLFGKGRLAWMRELWQQRQAIPLVSEATAKELWRVLDYPKFKLSKVEQEVLLNEYLPFCDRIEIPDSPPDVLDCRDPNDLPFLWFTIAGHAQYLVTGDRDLLSLAEDFPVPIVTAEVFHRLVTSN